MDVGRRLDGDLSNLKATELRLGLPGTDEPKTLMSPRKSKRALMETDVDRGLKSDGDEPEDGEGWQETTPVAKARIVGWPPVRSFRKNNFQAKKTEGENPGLYLKVSMDGAPYLRKIDLKVYKGYEHLREGLENMFGCFSIGSEYAITYEDKDGDWMLVGDVPWEMFTNSCKRLRVMKSSEARGVAASP